MGSNLSSNLKVSKEPMESVLTRALHLRNILHHAEITNKKSVCLKLLSFFEDVSKKQKELLAFSITFLMIKVESQK